MSSGRNSDDRSSRNENKTTPRFRLRAGLRTVIVLVGCCGVLLWTAHIVWEENRPAKVMIRALESRDPSERVDAIRELEQVGLGDSGIVIPPLIAALGDTKVEVRTAAAITLGTIGSDAVKTGTDRNLARAAISALLGALDDPEPVVRTAATTALGYVAGSEGSSRLIDLNVVIADLVARLSDRDAEIRLAVLHVLTAVGQASGVDPPKELAAALKDESAGNRSTAVTALVRFPRGLDPVVPHLFWMMEHDDEPAVRTVCAEAMERVRPPAITPAAVPALIAALGRPDRRVQAVACSTLIQFGSDARAAIPALIAIAREKRADPSIAEEWRWVPARLAIQALGRIAPGTELHGEAVSALIEVLRAEDASNRNSAIDALEPFGPAATSAIPDLILIMKTTPDTDRDNDAGSAARTLGRIAPGTPSSDEAVAVLTKALHSKSRRTRSGAIRALWQFGPQAATAIPRLRELVKDPDNYVRSAAESLLARLIRVPD